MLSREYHKLRQTYRLGLVHDLQIGHVAKRVDLTPVDGHTSPRLDVAKDLLALAPLARHHDDLLRLV